MTKPSAPPAEDVQSWFAQAEGHYTRGEFDDARDQLHRVLRVVGDHPAVHHLLALVEKQRGDGGATRMAFERAAALAPSDVQIANNYANWLSSIGEPEAALRIYDRALAAAPQFHAARYNQALLLQTMARHDAALTDLDIAAAAQPDQAKIHAARGASLLALRRFGEAAAAYDRAVGLDARRVVAVHGRAVVARERGESDASARYRQALALAPGDREIGLGLAEALEAEGDREGLAVMAALVADSPEWWAGQSILARMRWEAGDGAAFTAGFEAALAQSPATRDGWLAYASALAAADQSAAAADAAAAGRAAAGDDPLLTLLEALHASEAGQIERAARLYDSLPPDMPGRGIHESRHRLRIGDFAGAGRLIDQARQAAPWDTGLWAMTGIVWRLLDDPRADWLLAQPGLIAVQELPLDEDDLRSLAACLRGLHRSQTHPIGQSLRGGTQTRGRLFERDDAEIVALRQLIEAGVQRYWQALPPVDPAHPLLRHRGVQPRLSGSWSVRLTDGGFHVSHMHPDGIISSACYIAVPPPAAPGDGWLQIGGAPDQLDLPLEPLREVEPVPGRIVLFPSFCYHGTRRFPKGERLSVAFDVIAG